MTNQTAIARQPIFDRELKTYAYELLYRGNLRIGNEELKGDEGDSATSHVINNTFVDIGIEKVVGSHVAFLNMTRNLLIQDDPLPFSKDHVVLEILEDVVADDDVVAAVERLSKEGYKIALDDFIFDESLTPLIKLADIIKIDLLALTTEELEEHVTLLKQENVELLAEKVETQQQFDHCKELGFDYFQGYFFSKPALIKSTPIPGNHLNTLSLIGKLQNPDTDFDEIEKLISQDASLSYKLLKLLNSAAFAPAQKIESIKRGLVVIGFKAIKAWSTLIALNSLNQTTQELMNVALVRAKMCECLASEFNTDQDAAFTVGLFSTLEAMLLHPATELLEVLPLAEPVKQALLHQEGELGKMLDIVIFYEQGLWDKISTSKVSSEQLETAYLTATEWTISIQNSV